jgi:hypothetical protein
MPQVGFEPTIPVCERTKAAHALGQAAAVIGSVGVIFRKKSKHETSNQGHLHRESDGFSEGMFTPSRYRCYPLSLQ